MSLSQLSLSETLARFAQPMLDALGSSATLEAQQAALLVSACKWNEQVAEALGLREPADRARTDAELILFGRPLSFDETEGRSLLSLLERTKREAAPQDLRIMGEPLLMGTGEVLDLRLDERPSFDDEELEMPDEAMEEAFDQAWTRLLDAARAVKKLQPWNWMGMEHRFGIADPLRLATDWVRVTGAAPGTCGFDLYMGEAGGEQLERIASGEAGREPGVQVLSLRFVDREELEPQDVEPLERLGASFGGDAAWPMFRSVVDDEPLGDLMLEELQSLTVGLEQLHAVASRALIDPSHALADAEGRRLVRVPTRITGEPTWKDDWQPAPLQMPDDELVLDVLDADETPELDRAEAARVRLEIPAQRGKLECSIVNAPIEFDTPSGFVAPAIALFVESASGELVHTASRSPDHVLAQLPRALLEAVERRGARPNMVLVSDPDVADALEPAITSLGIRIKLVDSLPEADRLAEAIVAEFKRDPEDA
jgi:hypothetical protein